MNRHTLRAFAVVACFGVAACTPTTAVVDHDSRTPDGMVPVRDSGMDEAWVRPDLNLSSYRKLLLLPPDLEFRAVRPVATSSLARSNVREFPVSPEDQQRLANTLTEVFREELAKSRNLTLTTEAGPDVLVVSTALRDIVSRVPPEGPGRVDIYLDRIGEATLVLELKDGTSGAILARAVDRRIAERFDGIDGVGGLSSANRMNSVTTWSEVRREVRRWASSVTRRIDGLYTQAPAAG